MAILWLKFPDEALSSYRFSDDDKHKLDTVFSTDNPQSPWRKALDLLSLQGSDAPLLKWVSDCPYFNWSEMTRLISGGLIAPVKTDDGHYTFNTHYTLRSLGGLLATQWKITRFLTHPLTGDGTLAESLALGIALQSLILRLGGNIDQMATALAALPEATSRDRKVLEKIQSLQMRRTQISAVWNHLLPAQRIDTTMPLADFFWDDEIPAPVLAKQSTQTGQDNWKGLAVCTGKVTGLAVVVSRNDTEASLKALAKEYNAPLILIFRHARPQTVEFFPFAAALLFTEGGILSHACTVAREMNIPTITGLGADFFTQIENNSKTWLTLDGHAGTVTKVS